MHVVHGQSPVGIDLPVGCDSRIILEDAKHLILREGEIIASGRADGEAVVYGEENRTSFDIEGYGAAGQDVENESTVPVGSQLRVLQIPVKSNGRAHG